MPRRNGADRGCNIASRESEQTSARFSSAENWSGFNEGKHGRAPTRASAPLVLALNDDHSSMRRLSCGRAGCPVINSFSRA